MRVPGASAGRLPKGIETMPSPGALFRFAYEHLAAWIARPAREPLPTLAPGETFPDETPRPLMWLAAAIACGSLRRAIQ